VVTSKPTTRADLLIAIAGVGKAIGVEVDDVFERETTVAQGNTSEVQAFPK
jgi:hypothetical protein